MAREFVKYGYNEHGHFNEFGDVPASTRDRSRLFTMLDQLSLFYGAGIFEKKIELDQAGRATVTVVFDGDAWIDGEERADRLERMLKWLVLKMSAQELHYLGIVPRAADPAQFSVEQLIVGLTEQFDEFARADDRLRGNRK